MGRTIDGKAVAAAVRGEVRERAAQLAARGIEPGLATVLVGDDRASQIYVGSKERACGEVGIRSFGHRLPASIAQGELLELIVRLGRDDRVHGILVQLPLPAHIDEDAVILAVDPAKDVDCLHPLNAGLLYLGRQTLAPATPVGIMELLAAYDVELQGAKAVVVGRSNIVGKPVALLLLQQHATVTICHSRTRDLAHETLDADVLVVATGRAALVTAEMVKSGAAVVDVGMNRTDAGLVGDVDAAAMDVAGYMTPVPGGVGPMTIACLLRNTVLATRLQRDAV